MSENSIRVRNLYSAISDDELDRAFSTSILTVVIE